MKKLIDYLEKNGLDFERVEYGANYFYNVEKLIFDGVICTFDIRDGATARKVETYCKRYGYTVFRRAGFPGFQFFSIMRKDEKKQLDFIWEFINQSVSSCEKQIHLRNIGFYSKESDEEFNERLRGIMDYYGDEYKKALSDLNGATA